jgi:hypothetical protein
VGGDDDYGSGEIGVVVRFVLVGKCGLRIDGCKYEY